MHNLVMRFLTSIEGKYFNLTVDDIRADENGTHRFKLLALFFSTRV